MFFFCQLINNAAFSLGVRGQTRGTFTRSHAQCSAVTKNAIQTWGERNSVKEGNKSVYWGRISK